MDAYKAWLQERIAYWRQRCMESAAARSRPASEGVRFADPELKSILETYEDCLAQYEKIAPYPTPPDGATS